MLLGIGDSSQYESQNISNMTVIGNHSFQPTVFYSSPPSVTPSISPISSPNQSPTRSPTPFCSKLQINIIDAVGFDETLFEGLYAFDSSKVSNERPIFGKVNDKYIHYDIDYVGTSPNGYWIIETTETLRFGPTDQYYPPYGYSSISYNWTYNAQSGTFVHVLIECILSSNNTVSTPSTPIIINYALIGVGIVVLISIFTCIVHIYICRKRTHRTIRKLQMNGNAESDNDDSFGGAVQEMVPTQTNLTLDNDQIECEKLIVQSSGASPTSPQNEGEQYSVTRNTPYI